MWQEVKVHWLEFDIIGCPSLEEKCGVEWESFFF